MDCYDPKCGTIHVLDITTNEIQQMQGIQQQKRRRKIYLQLRKVMFHIFLSWNYIYCICMWKIVYAEIRRISFVWFSSFQFYFSVMFISLSFWCAMEGINSETFGTCLVHFFSNIFGKRNNLFICARWL